MKSRSGYCVALVLAGSISATSLAGAATKPKIEPIVALRPAGEPLMAIVSLRDQQITIYDDKGWIMQAPVSSGQRDRETPSGIFTVLQKNAEHYSNIYDDAFMPHMQRLTWSGIALHGGALPGYAASHGCVRLPYEFAERLFGATKLGMRVIISPGSTQPAAIETPALFKPRTGLAAAAAAVASAAERDATAKGEEARRAAMAAYRDWLSAMVPVRKMETLRVKANWELGGANRALEAAATPEAKQQGADARVQAAARIAELDAQLATARAELQPKQAVMTTTREAALAVEQARVAAAETAVKAARALLPVSVFISRKAQRLYVRQAREPIFEAPVTFKDAERPVGTHVFTVTERDGADFRWNVVSMAGGRKDESGTATAALDRIVIPQDALDFIAERIWARTSVIVSDEALSPETGEATEFVVTMSGEPQGSLKKRPRVAPRMEAGFGFNMLRF